MAKNDAKAGDLYTWEEVEEIKRAIAKGERVVCKACHAPLILRMPGSGYHPGIYCDSGCTEILIEVGSRD